MSIIELKENRILAGAQLDPVKVQISKLQIFYRLTFALLEKCNDISSIFRGNVHTGKRL